MIIFRKDVQNKMTETVSIKKDNIHIIKTGKHGKKITSVAGAIWITQTGDGIDRVLKNGDVYQTSLPGQIVIQALNTATFKTTSMNKVEVFGNSPSRLEPQLSCA